MTAPKAKILEAIEKLEEARNLLESTQQLEEAPTEEPLDGGSQTVRFTRREKAALQRLARAQRRSEHFIIKDILGPALLRAASELDS